MALSLWVMTLGTNNPFTGIAYQISTLGFIRVETLKFHKIVLWMGHHELTALGLRTRLLAACSALELSLVVENIGGS